MELFETKHFILKLTLFVSSLATLAGCTGDSGSVSGGGNAADASAVLTLQINSVYPTASGSSTIQSVDATNRTHIKGRSISIEGSCSRGVASVQIAEDSSAFANTTVPCDGSGNFIWTRSFAPGAEQNYDLSLSPVLGNGTVLSISAVPKKVRVDDVAPATPSITAPSAGGSYTQTSGSTVTISGTVASDVVKVLGPSGSDSSTGSGGLSLTGTNFSITVTLSLGSPTIYSFTGYDKAGNASTSATISISYIPAISIVAGGAIPGGIITGSPAFVVEASMNHQPFFAVDSGGFSLDLGFNRIVNEGRSQP